MQTISIIMTSNKVKTHGKRMCWILNCVNQSILRHDLCPHNIRQALGTSAQLTKRHQI
jgi:hypothetical protein